MSSTQTLPDGFVAIPATEYASLMLSQTILEALQAHGVDNWMGYDDAMESLFVEDDEPEDTD